MICSWFKGCPRHTSDDSSDPSHWTLVSGLRTQPFATGSEVPGTIHKFCQQNTKKDASKAVKSTCAMQ